MKHECIESDQNPVNNVDHREIRAASEIRRLVEATETQMQMEFDAGNDVGLAACLNT